MRLLTKTTLYFMLVMVPLLAAAGLFLFRQFSRELDYRVDRELVQDELQWIRYLRTATGPGASFSLRAPDIIIQPVDEAPQRYPTITDTYGLTPDNQRVPVRQLSHIASIHGVPYQIVIRKSQEQKAVLVSNIVSLMLSVFGALFAAMLLFNWVISQRLWRPFRATLDKIRHLDLQQTETVRFEASSTGEFHELNAALNAMTRKIHRDYVNMKEFTENAAHEMQTPLAVAQTKLELLLQEPSLSQAQLEAILQAGESLGRMSKLTQSLLLLAKIENHQYDTAATLDLSEVARKYLALFDELVRDKGLTVEADLEAPFVVRLHPLLGDSLVSNLVGNAIKYNYEGGKINVSVRDSRFCIANTSHLPPIERSQLFRRFHKPAGGADSSNGLGLAIVKKIVDVHGLRIDYAAAGGEHRFCLEKDA